MYTAQRIQHNVHVAIRARLHGLSEREREHGERERCCESESERAGGGEVVVVGPVQCLGISSRAKRARGR